MKQKQIPDDESFKKNLKVDVEEAIKEVIDNNNIIDNNHIKSGVVKLSGDYFFAKGSSQRNIFGRGTKHMSFGVAEKQLYFVIFSCIPF